MTSKCDYLHMSDLSCVFCFLLDSGYLAKQNLPPPHPSPKNALLTTTGTPIVLFQCEKKKLLLAFKETYQSASVIFFCCRSPWWETWNTDAPCIRWSDCWLCTSATSDMSHQLTWACPTKSGTSWLPRVFLRCAVHCLRKFLLCVIDSRCV